MVEGLTVIPGIEKGKRRCPMTKVIRCKDAGVDCDFVVRKLIREEKAA